MNIKKLFLEKNVGGYDLMLRGLLGSLAITALAMDLVESYPWNWVVALVAFVGLFSSITRHCSPYALLGISTAERTVGTAECTVESD